MTDDAPMIAARASDYIRTVARERAYLLTSEERVALRIGQLRDLDPTFVRCETAIKAVGACPERIFARSAGLTWWRGSKL